MKQKIIKLLEKRIYLIVLFLMILINGIFIFIQCNYERIEDYYEGIYPKKQLLYDKGWSASNKSGKAEPISLPQSSSLEVNTTYENVLPEIISSDTILAFFTKYQRITVKVGRRIIYKRGDDKVHKLNVGTENGWNFVHIPPKYSGRKISIIMDSSRYNTACRLTEVYLGKEKDVYLKLIFKYSGNIVLDINMILIGIELMFMVIAVWKNDILKGKAFCLGLFSIFLAILFHMGTVNVPFFVISNYTAKMLWYVTVLSLPLAITRYYAYQFNEQNEKKSFLNILFWLCVINWIINIVFIYFFHKDCIDMMKSIQIIYLLILITVLIKTLQRIIMQKKQETYHIIDACSTIFVILGMIIEYFVIYRHKIEYMYISMRILFFVFIMIMTISLFIELRSMIERYRDTRIQLDRASSKLMASQIQPHFIGNSLGTISYLIDSEPEKAKELLADLASYLRDNVKTIDSTDLIPVTSELEHVKRYLKIEKARFENRLNTIFDIKCTSIKVPALSIQPIVENAVKHGICKRVEGGTITIKTYEKDDSFVIQVADDGIGFDYEEYIKNQNDSYGMKNVGLRLKEQLNAELDIKSQPNVGTTVTIVIYKNT